ncbi:MAG: hypothetical protein QOK25_81 [Thermoleophilaceae bacterium]|nr:hypothetical protein [Thermoleophilaceae bacterium]
MSRRAIVLFAVLVAAGIGALTWSVGAADRVVAYSPGVPPSHVAAVVPPGHEVCQTPLPLPAPTDAVSLQVGTNHRPGIPLRVIVRDLHGRPLAEGGIGAGYQDGGIQTARFRTVPAGSTVSLCIRDVGRAPVYPYGSDSASDSGTVQDGRRGTVDLAITFFRPRPRSALSLVPAAFRHASVFRFDWVGAWTYWVLAALLVLGVPVLCAFAIRDAERGADEVDRRDAGTNATV